MSAHQNVFTTSRVSAIASKGKRLLADRTDLKMVQQHRDALVDTRNRLQATLMVDFEATIGTREEKALFLDMMVAEIQRFHLHHYGQRIPRRALEILAEHNAKEMVKEGNARYGNCLGFLGAHRPYDRYFLTVATQLVAQEQCASSSSSSKSSSGLSSSGMDE